MELLEASNRGICGARETASPRLALPFGNAAAGRLGGGIVRAVLSGLRSTVGTARDDIRVGLRGRVWLPTRRRRCGDRDVGRLHIRMADAGFALWADMRIERRLVAAEDVLFYAAAALVGLDSACRSHHGSENDVRPGAILETVDAERLGVGEFAALAAQPLLNSLGAKQRTMDAGEDLFLFETREKVRQQMRFLDQRLGIGNAIALALPAISEIGAIGRVQRHGGVIVAVKIEDDVAEHLEILADLLVVMNFVEAREDLDDRTTLGGAHLRQQPLQATAGFLHRDEQQAEIDEYRDRKRHVIAFRETCLIGHGRQLGLRRRADLDRLHGLLLQLAQLFRRRR